MCFGKGKISGSFFFETMNLDMLDRFCPILKTREQLEERRFDMNRSEINSERYVIPMHRKNFWNNKWMQDPRKIFFKLATMILVRSTRKVGDHLREKED